MRKLRNSRFVETNLKKNFFKSLLSLIQPVNKLNERYVNTDPAYEEYVKNYLRTTRWQTI